MSRKSRYTPRLESLESIALLSPLAPAAPGAGRAVQVGAAPILVRSKVVRLNGSLSGTYQVNDRIPDVGATYTFFGHGRVAPLGAADVTGNAHQLGFITTGRARGLLVLSTPQGSVTTTLQGPRQRGFSRLPDRFSFRIADASGQYRNDRGRGAVVIVLDPAAPGADRGTFQMVFVS